MKAPAIFLTCENCGKKIDISGTIYPVRVFKEKCDRVYPHIAPCCSVDCAEELIEKQLDALYMDFRKIQNQKIVSMACKKYIGGKEDPPDIYVPSKQENHLRKTGSISKKMLQKVFSKLPIRRT